MPTSSPRIGLLLGPMFEDQEFIYPYYRLLEAGYEAIRLGTNGAAQFVGKHGVPMPADRQASEVFAGDLAGIHIPGGYAPDHIRRDSVAVDLVRRLADDGKPIASICHGAWVLASANIVRGKRMTCFRGIKDDLVNAGADWVDEQTVVDGNLVTARKPADLPSYMRAFLELLP